MESDFEEVFEAYLQDPKTLTEGLEELSIEEANEFKKNRSFFLQDLLEWVRANSKRTPMDIEPFPESEVFPEGSSIYRLIELAQKTVLNNPVPVGFEKTNAVENLAIEPIELEDEDTFENLDDVLQAPTTEEELKALEINTETSALFNNVEKYCRKYSLEYINCLDEENSLGSHYVISIEQLAGVQNYELNKVVVLNQFNAVKLAQLMDRFQKLKKNPALATPKLPSVSQSLEDLKSQAPLGREAKDRKKEYKQALVTVPKYFPALNDPNCLRRIAKRIYQHSKNEVETNKDGIFFNYLNCAFEKHSDGTPHLHIAMTLHNKTSSYSREKILKFFADNDILLPNRLASNPYNIFNVSLSTSREKPEGPHAYVAKSYEQALASKSIPLFEFEGQEYLGYIGLKNTIKCKRNFVNLLSNCTVQTEEELEEERFVAKVKEQKKAYQNYTKKFAKLKEPFEEDVTKFATEIRQRKSETAVGLFNEALWNANARLVDMLPEKSSQIVERMDMKIAITSLDMFSIFDFAYSKGYHLESISNISTEEAFPTLKNNFISYPVSRKRVTNHYIRKKPFSMRELDFSESKRYCKEKEISYGTYHDGIIQKMLGFVVDAIKKEKRANILWIHGPPLRGKTKFVNWLRQYCSCVSGPLSPGQFILSSDSSSPDVFVYDDDIKPSDFPKMVEMWNSLSTSTDLMLSIKYDTIRAFRPSILICTNHQLEVLFKKDEKISQSLAALKKRITYIDLSVNDLILPPEFTGFTYSQIVEMTESIEHKDNVWVNWYSCLRNQGKYPYLPNTLDLESCKEGDEVLEKISGWISVLPAELRAFPKYFLPFVAYKIQLTSFDQKLKQILFKAIDAPVDRVTKEAITEKIGKFTELEFEEYTIEKYNQALLQTQEEYAKHDEIVMYNSALAKKAQIVKHVKGGCDIVINENVYPLSTIVGDNVQNGISLLRDCGFTLEQPDAGDEFSVFKRPGSPFTNEDLELLQASKKAKTVEERDEYFVFDEDLSDIGDFDY